MNTRRTLLLLGAAVTAFAQTTHPSDDPAQILYDTGVKDEAAGRIEQAKLLMVTLSDTYAGHPAAAKAKTEIGAIYLLLEAQGQARDGKTRAAFNTFRTVWTAYPESPLAKVAEESADALGLPPRRR